MMKAVHKYSGNGKYKICLDVTETEGHGLICVLTGGELPHLGGVALASPGTELHGSLLSSCDVWSVTIPGHKDTELAQMLAKKLCTATQEPVSVNAGVHVNGAQKEEVEQLCANSMKTVELFLSEYLAQEH